MIARESGVGMVDGAPRMDWRTNVAYGYQYIPRAPVDDPRARASAIRVGGNGGRAYQLDRAASAIAEAIAAVYRDIDELRSAIPDLAVPVAKERGPDVEAGAGA